jgi:hypothetical protein
MALVQCRECGASISRGAKTCPVCGRPRYMARLREGLFFLFLRLVLMTTVLVWFLWHVGLFKVVAH